jgi:hypothetical protein
MNFFKAAPHKSRRQKRERDGHFYQSSYLFIFSVGGSQPDSGCILVNSLCKFKNKTQKVI